jgi:hypothetical protein
MEDINQKMRTLILPHIPTYVATGVVASLTRNSHMNDFWRDPEQFDEGIVPEMLQKMLKVSTFRNTGKGDVLEDLVAGAKAIRLHTDVSLKQTTIDAILVDFCNYVGGCQWVDLGLYTSDLVKG